MRPRRGLLVLGFLLMVINRVAGLVLPYSTKFLIDTVITKHHMELLRPWCWWCLGATLVQGIDFLFADPMLSKAAQRLIAELRRKVQAHISRLPVAFYDANKTGALVSRIMSDVEGVRNLLGTGLVDFAGGLITSGIALVVAVAHQPADDADCGRFLAMFCRRTEQGVRHDSSDFPRAQQNQCGGHGAADGIAGRRARDQGISRGRARRSCVCERACSGCSIT